MASLMVDGVRIETREGYGRVLLARRSFAAGEIVLREAPLLLIHKTFERDGSMPILTAFQSASRETKEKVLMDFFCPELGGDSSGGSGFDAISLDEDPIVTNNDDEADGYDDHPVVREIRDGLKRLELSSDQEEFLMRLLLIELCNAHGYEQQSEPPVGEHVVRRDGRYSGLFEIASKASHSCDPNVTFHSNLETRLLTYRALKPISEGEMICLSYLSDDELQQPITKRRARLWLGKLFWCFCSRCNSRFDDCRSFICLHCGGGDLREVLSTGTMRLLHAFDLTPSLLLQTPLLASPYVVLSSTLIFDIIP